MVELRKALLESNVRCRFPKIVIKRKRSDCPAKGGPATNSVPLNPDRLVRIYGVEVLLQEPALDIFLTALLSRGSHSTEVGNFTQPCLTQTRRQLEQKN